MWNMSQTESCVAPGTSFSIKHLQQQTLSLGLYGPQFHNFQKAQPTVLLMAKKGAWCVSCIPSNCVSSILYPVQTNFIVMFLRSCIVRQPSSSIRPRTQNLISLLKGGHSAYFTIEYQFSIYIIEVFAKKLHIKMLPHTEYSFSKLGHQLILAVS